MNRKRKILTVVALAVFGAIVGLLFVYFEPARSRPMTSQEFYEWKETQPQEYANWIKTRPFDPMREHALRYKWYNEYDDVHSTGPKVEDGWYFGVRSASISDFGVALFVLAVFYAGLFAILGDKKRDSQ
jgi:hypothetical protein